MSQLHVVVIGGGVLGACVASALVDGGARVSVVDAAVPGSGTSSSSFAWVNAQKKQPDAYFQLNFEGLREYQRLAANGVGKRWFHAVGNLEVATDQASSAALAARVGDLAARGYDAALITGRRAADLERLVSADRIVDAAVFPSEGWVDAEAMIADMLANVRAAGGQIRHHCPVQAVDQVGSQVRLTFQDGQNLRADYVVCAAGTATQQLLATSGVSLPMVEESHRTHLASGEERYTAVGGLADTAPLRVPLRRVLHTPDMGLRPGADGRAVLGGDGAGSRVRRTDDAVFDNGPRLLRRAQATFPALGGVTLDRVRVGVRSIPADGLTVAGLAPGLPGLYVMVTHSGITLAQYLARQAATELLTQQDLPLLKDFRPARFGPAPAPPAETRVGAVPVRTR